MHEAGIADRVLDAVLEQAASAGATRVDAVVLEVGDACGVSLEALAFHWLEHARGSAAEGARLEIVHVEDPLAFRLVALDVDETGPTPGPARATDPAPDPGTARNPAPATGAGIRAHA